MNALPDSSNTVTKKHYIIVAVWLAVTIISAIFFIQRRLVAFDPQQQLLSVSAQELVMRLLDDARLHDKNGQLLVQFVEPGCFCNSASKQHIADIGVKAKAQDFSVVNIEVPPSFSSLLTATPAALLLGKQGELLYFGPMSSGLACSSSGGFIEMVMNNYQQGFASEFVNNLTRGCYCSRASV